MRHTSDTVDHMPTSPGPLLQALDALWDHIRTTVADLPPARVAVSPAPPSSKHDSGRWAWDGDVVTGLVISADVLSEGPEAATETVLHEAAHVLCWVRGVPDTATRGAYHNGVYLKAAEEVGLHWPADAARTQARGFANPTMTDATRDRYAPDIATLTDAIPKVLPHLTVPDTPARHRTPNRLAMQCGCHEPRKLQMSRTVAARGPVICGVCEQPFTEA